jgi:DNA polymerase III subunit delta'
MVVGEDGALALPWLQAPLAEVLSSHRGHALLVQGNDGIGMLPFALTLAQAWLCEGVGRAEGQGPCGRCGSCRLVQSHLHPDLQVLMPEQLRRQHEWLRVDDKAEADDKRKPSKQIRIDEVRSVIDWVFKTSARGRGKVVVLHPAETMNLQSANALLKTLEEPPAGTRLVLTTADSAGLLPTVRSRCQHLRMPPPTPVLAQQWLSAQGVAQPEVLLAAASGRPLDAWRLAQDGVQAQHWRDLPAAVARGQAGVLHGWPLPRVLDALHKVCHDAMAAAVGAPGRYFPAGSLPSGVSLPALSVWLQELDRLSAHEDHPWNEGLALDALLARAARALRVASARPDKAAKPPRFDTLAS